jgi:hypothetical protein
MDDWRNASCGRRLEALVFCRVASAAAFVSSLLPGCTFIGLGGKFNAMFSGAGLAFLSILTFTLTGGHVRRIEAPATF